MSKKNIPTIWFQHLPESEQASFKEVLLANNRVLDRLRDILRADLNSLEAKEESLDNYDAGYPFKQALFNGERKRLKNVLNYLAFLEE